MKNATFWRAVDGEHVLVFQTDAALCRASAKSVEDYLDWAFVGAPWNEGAKCGNGGLSLRKRSAMLDVLLRPDGPAATNEDEHFCARLRHFGYPMPDFETGRSFSIEMAYYPSPVGLHQVFYHHRIGTDWLYEIHRGCPESRVISTPPCRRTACGNDAKVKAAMNRTAVCEAPFKEARKDRRARDRPVECDITAGFVQPKKGP
ncbi:hypothetical protein DFJ74DRAFT_656837 [Hyaloraphidium curvatum]|nr:hypothetical protein DFJ74DRAFT_656837 [Hyaloraphidium curvatum]